MIIMMREEYKQFYHYATVRDIESYMHSQGIKHDNFEMISKKAEILYVAVCPYRDEIANTLYWLTADSIEELEYDYEQSCYEI